MTSAPSRSLPFLFALSITLVLFWTSVACAINVRDFGAKGDGSTDDTRALQAAILAAEARRDQVSKVGDYHKMGNAMGSGPHPEVFFPKGTYRISAPLVAEANSSLRGESGAIIEQVHSDQPIFYFHRVVRVQVDGLTLRGGATQLLFWTQNRGGVRLSVANCHFIGSSGPAVECLSFTQSAPRKGDKGWGNVVPWAPFEVTLKDGLRHLTPSDNSNLKEWFNSTSLTIDGSTFEECAQAVRLQCDNVVISNSKVTTARNAEGPVFHLSGGKAHLLDITGLARVNPEKKQYWVGGNGLFSLRRLRLDTDSENGLCLFRSERRKDVPLSISIGAFSLIVEDCEVKSAGSPEDALVWISRQTQPSILSVQRNRELSDRPVHAVRWEREPKEAALTRMADVSLSRAPLINQYHLCVAGNAAPINESIPDSLKTYVRPAVPVALLKEATVPPLAWRASELEAEFTEVIDATAHGIALNPTLDQTQALQALLNHAATLERPLVLLPGSALLISDTLTLPPHIALRGSGITLIVMKEREKDFFHAKEASAISLRALHFAGGSNVLKATTPTDSPARIAAYRCSFTDHWGRVMEVTAGDTIAPCQNETEVLIEDCTIGRSRQAIVTNAARSEMASCFVSNHQRLNDEPFLANHGGAMRMATTLTNPYIWKGESARKKSPYIPADWPYSNNVRWVDNYGKFFATDVRFGGEDEGMCNVFHRTDGGSLAIEGGFTRFYNDASTLSAVHFEKPPRLAIISNFSGLPWAHKEAKLWSGNLPDPTVLHLSAIMPPQP